MCGGAELVPVVAQVTGHPQATCRMGPRATTLSWVALRCPMHVVMGTLGCWIGLSRDVLPADQYWHLPSRAQTGDRTMFCGGSQTPLGKAAGLEGRVQLQDEEQPTGTPGSSQGRYAGHSGVTVSAEGLWMDGCVLGHSYPHVQTLAGRRMVPLASPPR